MPEKNDDDGDDDKDDDGDDDDDNDDDVDDVEVVDDTLISASEPIQRGRGEPRHLAKGTLIITTTSTIIIKKKRKRATHSKTKSDPQDTPDDKLYNIPRVLSNSR